MKNKNIPTDKRGWYYASHGDYHRNLDLNWSYAPTYLSKMRVIQKYLRDRGKGSKILDAGCGEGVLVEEFRNIGYKIEGIDLNYESEYVRLGDLRDLPYDDNSFDIVLLLDVFEHFEFRDQLRVLSEVNRVLHSRGTLLATIPNLLHLNSRFLTLFFGHLDRTDSEYDHPGERPLDENRKLLIESRFDIIREKGITVTIPVLTKLIRRFPKQFLWLHDIVDVFAFPSLSMITLFVCQKRD